jgi:hypothetical protein
MYKELGVDHLSPVLKALAAQHRSSLRRPERNGGFFSALRAVCPGFGLRVRIPAWSMRRRSPEHRYAFSLTVFAAFGFVFELLVVKKQLFTRCEHEIRATINAL